MGMMTALRSRMKTILLILVVAFVITIVFSWGMGGFKGKYEPGVIGKVAGVKIYRERYDDALENRLSYERQASDQPMDENRTKQLRQEVWDGLVNEILLAQYREKAGIKVTDKEIAFTVKNYPLPTIMQSPAFQDTLGRFNKAFYDDFLANPVYENQVIMLEQSTRQQLEQQKMIQRLSSAAHVSDEELKEAYIRDNTLAEASFILVTVRKLEADSSDVSEEEIEQAYNERKEEFLAEETRTVQHVLFEDNPSKEDTLDASEITRDLRERLDNGANFEELAIEYSEDGSAGEGGDLGWFGKGKMVKAFETAAFNAEIGELVGPVETKFGFHLIRVDEKKGSGDDTELKARHILIKIERSQQTLENVRNAVDGFREEAAESDFATAAKIHNTKIDTIEGITKSGFIPRLGRNLAATEFLYNRPVGEISPVYNFQQGYVVMKVIDVEEEHYKPIEEARKKLFRNLYRELKFQLAEKEIQRAYEKVLATNSLEEGAEEVNVEVKKSRRPFKVDEFVSGVGRDLAFTQTVFNLKVGEISKPIKGKKGYIIARLDSLSEANMDNWESEKDSKLAELQRARQQEIYDGWLAKVREKAKIEDFRYLYYTQY